MAEARIYVPKGDADGPARTYNQIHLPRKFAAGRRRVSIYVSWSFPGEANRDVTELDNRFSTMTEVRRVEWPNWEGPEWAGRTMFQQGIAGWLIEKFPERFGGKAQREAKKETPAPIGGKLAPHPEGAE